MPIYYKEELGGGYLEKIYNLSGRKKIVIKSDETNIEVITIYPRNIKRNVITTDCSKIITTMLYDEDIYVIYLSIKNALVILDVSKEIIAVIENDTKIEDCHIFKLGNDLYVETQKENKKNYYRIYNCDIKQIKKMYINTEDEYENEMKCAREAVDEYKRKIENYSQEINQYKKEIEALKKEYKRQYEELYSTAIELQKEGKRWRELYQKSNIF